MLCLKTKSHDCDECGGEGSARYIINDAELCEKCAEELLLSNFEALNIKEKATALSIEIKTINQKFNRKEDED